MIYLYQAHHPRTNTTKVGLTTTKSNGNTRINDYARDNGLPTKGWQPAQHFALDTDDWSAARAVEQSVHEDYRTRGKTVRKGGRVLREAFKSSEQRGRWLTLAMAKASGLYKKGG